MGDPFTRTSTSPTTAMKLSLPLQMFFVLVALGCVCDVLLLLFPYHPSARAFARYSLGVFMAVASIPHFTSPRIYLPIMPPVLPAPMFWIVASGVCEALLAVMCFVPQPAVQGLAAWGVTLLLVAIFPANVWAAVSKEAQRGMRMPPWFAWVRLPIQVVFLYWSYALTDKGLQAAVEGGVQEVGRWMR